MTLNSDVVFARLLYFHGHRHFDDANRIVLFTWLLVPPLFTVIVVSTTPTTRQRRALSTAAFPSRRFDDAARYRHVYPAAFGLLHSLSFRQRRP